MQCCLQRPTRPCTGRATQRQSRTRLQAIAALWGSICPPRCVHERKALAPQQDVATGTQLFLARVKATHRTTWRRCLTHELLCRRRAEVQHGRPEFLVLLSIAPHQRARGWKHRGQLGVGLPRGVAARGATLHRDEQLQRLLKHFTPKLV